MSDSITEKPSESKEHAYCMKRLESTVANNRTAQKLIDSISNLGCQLPKDLFVCRKCDFDMSGGFMLPQAESTPDTYRPRIVMCEDKKMERETFEHTVIHELIHAYDLCRAKIDWNNCEHHACTEVRASALSGECNILHEIYRGKTPKQKGHQECVRRRALKSVAMNGKCKDTCVVDVELAMAKCYADVAPFDTSR